MPDEPVTLPIRCPKCGQAVTLTYKPGGRYRTWAWTCPHAACGRLHKIDLHGLKVIRRSHGKGEVEVITEVQLWDKNAALNLLSKYHKLLTDKVEVNTTAVHSFKTDEELEKMSNAEFRAEHIRAYKMKIEDDQKRLAALERGETL